MLLDLFVRNIDLSFSINTTIHSKYWDKIIQPSLHSMTLMKDLIYIQNGKLSYLFVLLFA